MDPTLTVVLAATGLALVKKRGTVWIGGAAKKIEKAKEKKERKKELYENLRRQNPDVQIKREEQLKALSSTSVLESFRFWDLERRESKKIRLTRTNKFDIEKDIIIHGRLLVRGNDGVVRGQDIFLYQPRLYARNNILIGPRLNEKGHIVDKSMYACNDPEAGVLVGYAAKREIVSGISIDYDVEAEHPYEERIQGYKKMTKDEQREMRVAHDFLQVVIDRDEDGNIIPFDLSIEENKELFASYVARHKKDGGEFFSYKKKEARAKARERIKEVDRRAEEAAVEMNVEAKRAEEEATKAQAQAQRVTQSARPSSDLEKKLSDYYQYGIKPSYASNLPDMPPAISRPYDMPSDRMIDPSHMHHHP